MVCKACYAATSHKALYCRYLLDESRRGRPVSGLLFLYAWGQFLDGLSRVEGCTCMAKNNAKLKGDWKGFANVPFDAEARARYETDAPPAAEVYRVLEDLISDGYRVTFSFDKTNDCYQCSVTCQNEKRAESGYTLTARGPGWFDALSVVVFKHSVLAPDGWPLAEKTQGDKWG